MATVTEVYKGYDLVKVPTEGYISIRKNNVEHAWAEDLIAARRYIDKLESLNAS